jgi:hypothetical protein
MIKDYEQQKQNQQVSSSSHRKQQFTPILSFSTSRNQIFIFLLLFFDIFSQLGAYENKQHQISA